MSLETVETAIASLQVSGEAPRLRRELSAFGVLLLTLSSLSPVVSIFGIGGDVLHSVGTGAAVLFALGILGAIVWAVVYAELGSAYPYAGGDYVGVGTILGSWAGVVTLALWGVTAGPATAFSVQALAIYVGQLWPHAPLTFVPVAAVAAAVLVSLLAVRLSAIVTGVFLAVEAVAVLALIAAGVGRPVAHVAAIVLHPTTLTPHGLTPVAFAALALAAISAVYATVGGNQAIYFGEELGDPHRRMGPVILWACLVGAFATATPVIVVVLTAHDLAAILRSPAPFAAFLSEKFGPGAGPALGAAVALAIFNAVIAMIMGFARLYYSLGRDRLFTPGINRLLADVDPNSGAPRAATLVLGAITAGCCLFSSHTLLVFISGLLVYGWGLVCLAVLVGRFKGLTGGAGRWRSSLFPLAPVLGLVMVAVFTIADFADADAGRPSLILLGLVVAAAVLWSRYGLERRPGGWRPTLDRDATELSPGVAVSNR